AASTLPAAGLPRLTLLPGLALLSAGRGILLRARSNGRQRRGKRDDRECVPYLEVVSCSSSSEHVGFSCAKSRKSGLMQNWWAVSNIDEYWTEWLSLCSVH